MAKKTAAEIPVVATDPGLRRCIGSTRYGIEPHEAPVGEFPRQPSQKDGLGRMCTVHWNAYTAGLARDAKARKAGETAASSEPAQPDAGEQPASPKLRRVASTPQGNRFVPVDGSDQPAAEADAG